jgi:hypothetical protein
MAEMEGEFEIFYYQNVKYYRCNRNWSTGHKCRFDTFHLESLVAHIRELHPETVAGNPLVMPAPPVPGTTSPILGPDGQPIVYEVPGARFKEE